MTSMFQFLSWYIAVTIIGWLVFPLAYRLLPALPDKGYAFIRVLGLLLWGFVFWLLDLPVYYLCCLLQYR